MEERQHDKVLRLKGRDLRCIPTIPLGLVFDLAEAMEGGGGNGMQAVAAYIRTIRAVVMPEDRPALKEVLDDSVDPITFDDLNNGLGELLKAYGQRPLGQRSASSAGRPTSGGTSRVVSLWPDKSRPVEQPSRDGRSAAS